MQNSATSYVSNFGTELKHCFIRIPSSFAPKYDGTQKGRLEMSKKYRCSVPPVSVFLLRMQSPKKLRSKLYASQSHALAANLSQAVS